MLSNHTYNYTMGDFAYYSYDLCIIDDCGTRKIKK